MTHPEVEAEFQSNLKAVRQAPEAICRDITQLLNSYKRCAERKDYPENGLEVFAISHVSAYLSHMYDNVLHGIDNISWTDGEKMAFNHGCDWFLVLFPNLPQYAIHENLSCH